MVAVVTMAVGPGLAACGHDDSPAVDGAERAATPAVTTAKGGVAEGAATEGSKTAGDERSWVTVTDEPSRTTFALPAAVEAVEDTAPAGDGSEVTLRNYSTMAAHGLVEVGFNVLDTEGASYDLAAGVAGVADTLGGVVVSSEMTDVDGHEARAVEMTYGDGMLVLFELITTDQHVLQTLASGQVDHRADVEDAYERITDSVAVG